MKSKINLKFFLIIFLLSFSIVKGQNSGIEILRKVMENTLNLENALYNFTINSKNENDLFPTNGRLYVQGKKYFIDTEVIDQIYDGSMFYTIIHENKEIIVTSVSNTFFNFRHFVHSCSYVFIIFCISEGDWWAWASWLSGWHTYMHTGMHV